MFDVARNLALVRERVQAAARASGRDPVEITLLAVSKTQPLPSIRAALAAAQHVCGEKYLQEALDKIAAGLGDGCAFSAHRTGRASERWAGSVLVRGFKLDEADAARVIAAWLRSGLLLEEEYRHPTQRKLRMGVRVVDARRPTVSAAETGNLN